MIVRCEAKYGHHLGGGRDVKAILARNTVHHAAQTDEYFPQRPVVEVNHPSQHDPARIDLQGIAMLQVVVEHGGQQVVGLFHGVHVADKMQIDGLRWAHL